MLLAATEVVHVLVISSRNNYSRPGQGFVPWRVWRLRGSPPWAPLPSGRSGLPWAFLGPPSGVCPSGFWVGFSSWLRLSPPLVPLVSFGLPFGLLGLGSPPRGFPWAPRALCLSWAWSPTPWFFSNVLIFGDSTSAAPQLIRPKLRYFRRSVLR